MIRAETFEKAKRRGSPASRLLNFFVGGVLALELAEFVQFDARGRGLAVLARDVAGDAWKPARAAGGAF